ncbi:MAG: methylated-DNA--[protein]-cysteine S-methyltransferase [Candidatus Lokiarchaeota archaeon]|nr:methylated-DNA--[protein]-cysteine S-methyltransferase [Candidatus Lokiarchaeota archaeon]
MSIFLYKTFSSPFNPYTIVWEEEESKIRIERIFLSDAELKSDKKALNTFKTMKLGSSPSITLLNEKIQRFFQGEDIKFQLNLLNFNRCFEFQTKVLLAESEIPRGWISTYKRIAEHLGKSNASRVVGNALAKNPFPIMIPCHRAIRSDGDLGGFQGGIPMKHSLLELEGIKFSDKGKVIMNRIYY